MKNRYLLILSCSKKKLEADNIPAIDLYDGPFYKVLRKNRPENLDVYILSAKYGLINASKRISKYDEKMTIKKAEQISKDVYKSLNAILSKRKYKTIFINLGKTYKIALKESEGLLEYQPVIWINGQIGERLQQLKKILMSIKRES